MRCSLGLDSTAHVRRTVYANCHVPSQIPLKRPFRPGPAIHSKLWSGNHTAGSQMNRWNVFWPSAGWKNTLQNTCVLCKCTPVAVTNSKKNQAEDLTEGWAEEGVDRGISSAETAILKKNKKKHNPGHQPGLRVTSKCLHQLTWNGEALMGMVFRAQGGYEMCKGQRKGEMLHKRACYSSTPKKGSYQYSRNTTSEH